MSSPLLVLLVPIDTKDDFNRSDIWTIAADAYLSLHVFDGLHCKLSVLLNLSLHLKSSKSEWFPLTTNKGKNLRAVNE
jgi:hypothetical protein